MASNFAGIHVECGFVTAVDSHGSTQPVLSSALSWSENVTSAGTTVNQVPSGSGTPILTITVLNDSWIAIGASPTAASGAGFFFPAGSQRQFAARQGDKVAWIAA